MEGERREFLPPKPPGPEPELGEGPPPAEPQAPAPGAPPAQQYAPPAAAQQPPGWQPPAPGYGWQHPPPPGYGHAPVATEPDNGPAVTGFVLSIVSGGLLVISGGLSSIISVGCSIFAIVYSRKGKKKVESGETSKNHGLAKAGFIIGIVGLVLAALATIGWTIAVILIATDEEFRRDFEDQFDDDNTIRAMLQLGAVAGRLLLG